MASISLSMAFIRFVPARAGNTPTGQFNALPHPGSSPRVRGTLGAAARGEVPDRFIPARAGNTGGQRRQVFGARGSSPRVRGTLEHRNLRPELIRFIPARAGNTVSARRHAAPAAVHPRACGEHSRHAPIVGGAGGSSPRVRGTRASLDLSMVGWRFIPARAGNTSLRPTDSPRASVHPRACGEHVRRRNRLSHAHGSSPRVRGTQHIDFDAGAHPRFIPARAGNTRHPAPQLPPPSVHPRACGEHLTAHQHAFIPHGSSPRVRGTPRCPASAAPPPPVHPRACGEHPRLDGGRVGVHGSSPRVRGTPAAERTRRGDHRFIPARAGNTSRRPGRRPARPVHPRACGEHQPAAELECRHVGSSPRVRGTPPAGPPGAPGTPVHPRACGEHESNHRLATTPPGSSPRVRGTRPRTPPSSAPTSVHPRACGEHGVLRRFTASSVGSSPRVRGTRRLRQGPDLVRRFIPARAGNTTTPRPR